MKSDTSGCAKRHWWSGLGRGVVRLVREARRVLAASAMAAVLLCAGSWGAAATPNVVLIQADDLGWPHNSLTTMRDLATARGDTDAFYETPNLEALAGQGMSLNNYWCPSPVCSPSRLTLLTGLNPADHHMTQYLNGNAAYGTDDWIRNIPDETITLAEVFDQAGYATAHLGKWHLGQSGDPGGDPTQHGYDVNVGGGRAGYPDSYFADADGSFHLPNLRDGSSNPGEYLPDRLARAATDFIAQAAGNGDPFFVALNHYAVHIPIEARAADVAYYRSKLDNGTYTLYDDELTDAQKDDLAVYASMVDSVDDSLGTVMAQLQTSGVADNTVVVFTSDHGGLNVDRSNKGFDAPENANAPLREGKGYPYEGGLRAPAVISAPGITVDGGISDAAVTTADLYPTLIELAGLDPASGNPDIYGESMTGVLDGSDAVGRDSTIAHFPHTSNQGASPFSTIRTGDWKLIESYYEDGTSELELYNLAADIGETNDLAAQEPQRVESMRGAMRDYLRSVNAALPPGHLLTEPTNPPDSTVLINFYTEGTAANEQPVPHSGMNNIDQFGNGEGQMVRVDGSDSSITFATINPAGGSSDGSEGVIYGGSGDNPFDLDGLNPTATHIHGLYNETGADGIARFEIAGLETADPDATYDILLWASRGTGSTSEPTSYELLGFEGIDGPDEYSFVVRDNRNTLIEFLGVSEFGGDGAIELYVENFNATGAVVLNAVRIDVVPEPTALVLLGLGGLGVLTRRRRS